MYTTWVFIKSEPQLWTVGFYDPNGKWQAESDHNEQEEAAKRVHFLNGGSMTLGKEQTMKEAQDKYQLIVDALNKELKSEIKRIDFKDSVELEIGHDRRIEIEINMVSFTEEVLQLINDTLPPKDDFWEDTI